MGATATRTTATRTTTTATTSAASSDTESNPESDSEPESDRETADTDTSRAPTEKMEQSLFVIPSHMLNCSPVSAANASDQSERSLLYRDLDGPEAGYEPCYRPFDIFAIYQNRLSFQGKNANLDLLSPGAAHSSFYILHTSSPRLSLLLLSSVFLQISPGPFQYSSR